MKKIFVCLLSVISISFTGCWEDEKVTVDVNIQPKHKQTDTSVSPLINSAWKTEENNMDRGILIIKEDSIESISFTYEVTYGPSKLYDGYIGMFKEDGQEVRSVKLLPSGKLAVKFPNAHTTQMKKTTIAAAEAFRDEVRNPKRTAKPITNLVPWK